MAYKVILIAAFVAVAKAGVAPIGPVAYAAGAAIDTDYDPNPAYSYAYDVQDALTGDSKNQQESRQGDVVQGSYSLTEPDGTRRTVEYTADPVNGFNAVVHREPLAVAKVAAPVAYAAPAYAPRAYAAPISAYHGAAVAPVAAYHGPAAYAAPVARYAAPLSYGAYPAPYARTILG